MQSYVSKVEEEHTTTWAYGIGVNATVPASIDGVPVIIKGGFDVGKSFTHTDTFKQIFDTMNSHNYTLYRYAN